MLDRHADPLDEAAALSSQLVDQAILHASRAANTRESHPDFDGESCLTCGDLIPPARLAMGKIRCVACQSAREKKSPVAVSHWPQEWMDQDA